MARYRLLQSHFKSSYRFPRLIEPGEILSLDLGQWPAPASLWTPLDTDARARQGAQDGYTRILNECRQPISRDADERAHVASERPATRAAQLGRRRIYEILLAKLPKDDTVAPALKWLKEHPQAPAVLKDDLKALALELADEIAQEYIEGRRPNEEEPNEETDLEAPQESDPMTDRRVTHPSQGDRVRDRAMRDAIEAGEEPQAAVPAEEPEAPAPRPAGRARRAAARAADREI